MRIKWVDYGKGVAILLVILGHVALGSLQSGNFHGSDVLILHIILEMTYAIHIPVFFALSGYFFKPITKFNEIWPREFKRLVSLGIPYITFSLVMVIVKSVGGASVRNQNGITGLINIYKTPIDYLWFLYALFFVDILVSILSYFFRSKFQLSIILLLGFLIQTIFPSSIEAISNALLWSPFFLLGYILREVQISKRLALLSLIIYFIHIPVFCMLFPQEYYLSGYWRIISVFCVFMMFYFFEHHRGFDYNFIEWCGLGSIVLYLVHAPVASVVRIALFKLGINSLWLQIAGQLSISIAVSLLVLWLANQNKFINFFFRPTKYLLANKFGKKVS